MYESSIFEMISSNQNKMAFVLIDFGLKIGGGKIKRVVNLYLSLLDDGVVGCIWLGRYGTYWLLGLPF